MLGVWVVLGVVVLSTVLGHTKGAGLGMTRFSKGTEVQKVVGVTAGHGDDRGIGAAEVGLRGSG